VLHSSSSDFFTVVVRRWSDGQEDSRGRTATRISIEPYTEAAFSKSLKDEYVRTCHRCRVGFLSFKE
jgi:hypothetical protein